MIITHLKRLLNSPILRLGITSDTKPNTEKKIYLVNIICVLHLISFIQVVFLGCFFDERLISQASLIGYLVPTFIFIFIFYLQYTHRYKLAKTLLILTSFLTCFIFDVYISPDIHVEFYYIIPALIALIIFDSKTIPKLCLCFAIFLFLDVLHFKNGINLKQSHFSVFFIILFLIPYFLIKTISVR